MVSGRVLAWGALVLRWGGANGPVLQACEHRPSPTPPHGAAGSCVRRGSLEPLCVSLVSCSQARLVPFKVLNTQDFAFLPCILESVNIVFTSTENNLSVSDQPAASTPARTCPGSQTHRCVSVPVSRAGWVVNGQCVCCHPRGILRLQRHRTFCPLSCPLCITAPLGEMGGRVRGPARWGAHTAPRRDGVDSVSGRRASWEAVTMRPTPPPAVPSRGQFR